MKILFDHLCFWQRYGGVPLYFSEIIKRLPPEKYILTARYSNNVYLEQLGIHIKPFLKDCTFRGKSRIEAEIGKLWTIKDILSEKYDIYHQTHYDPFAYKWLSSKVRTVTTIHDLNFFAIPEFYPENSKLKRDMVASIGLADHIITISQNSKSDLCKYLDYPEDKITVIYHGVDMQRFSAASEIKDKEDYIVFVGARNKYKNFVNMIKSFAILKQKYSSLKLYCIGTQPTHEEITLLTACGVLNDVRFMRSADNELPNIYHNALMFVFPSFYEGFGLPILESMASGCPVVLSGTSCFPEIAKDAGLYFEPHDVESIASEMIRLIEDSELRKAQIIKGYRRVNDFSWDVSYEKHLEVYRSLL